MFSISPSIFKEEPPPPPPPAVLFSLIRSLSIPGAMQINHHKQAAPTLGSLQLEWGFLPFLQILFLCSACSPLSGVQHTALCLESYCSMVQRNLLGGTLMTAPSLPTSTALSPSTSTLLPAPRGKSSSAAQEREDSTTYLMLLQQPELHTHQERCRRAPRSCPLKAPEVDCLQLQQAAAHGCDPAHC